MAKKPPGKTVSKGSRQSRGDGESTKLAGPLLAGRYAFVRDLGRGASGRVILVRDEGAEGALRALKIVPRAEAARLSWECDLLTVVAHPNLAPVYELVTLPRGAPAPFGLPPGGAALVEAFAPGLPASAAVRRLPEDERVPWALGVGVAVGRALGAIHRAGLVHGDVKPANIVVGEDPMRSILIDLGLSRPPGMAPSAAGTPAYLAPEAWQGQRSTAVDLYALGATLHQLLGGKSSLADTRSASIAELWARATASPRDPATLPASVPAALRRLIEALLDTEPTRRPASARDVVARLSSIQREFGGRVAETPEDVLAELSAAPTNAERAMAVSALALVGRGPEVSALEAAFGGPGVAVVRGPTGAGRTRLVEEAVRGVQRQRAEAGAAVPTFLRTSAVLPEAPGHDAVLLVEEADHAALDDARALITAAELDGHELMVVLERSSALEGVDYDLALGALDAAGVKELLAKLGGRAPGASLVDAALEASGGLPGRLCRLLAGAILDDRDITRPEALRAGGEGGYGAGDLPARGLAAAEYLAVAGGTVSGEVLTDLLGIDAARGLAALATEGALSFGPDGWPRLRRDLVVAIHSGMPPKRRRAISTELAARARGVTARAFSLSSAGDSEAAATALLQAIGERRRGGDAEGAIGLVRLAEALFDEQPAGLAFALSDALRARGRYGEALSALEGDASPAASCLRAELLRLSGRRGEATDALAAIPGAGDPALQYAARATAARLVFDGGDPGGALTLALAAADDAANSGHGAGEARAAEVAALSALYTGDLEEAGRLADRALAAAEGAGQGQYGDHGQDGQDGRDAQSEGTGGEDGSLRHVEARIHAVAASVALGRGEVHRAATLYGRAFELAEAAGERHAAAAFLLNLGVTRLDAGDLGPATLALREGARRLARLGRDLDLSRALYNLGLAGVLTGDDDLARVAVQNARTAADRAADRTAAAFASILEAELALRGGRLARAREAADEARERGAASSARDRTVVAARRALILAALGEAQAAKAALLEARGAAEEDGSDLTRTEAAVAAARVALAADSPAEAQEAAAEALAAAER
ncbi:MAG: serine/threonine-protein kinase PknK, partial [Deltaproteobacteria bacterium]|nr:serine/threonine-protein kinase PknK [Deltaproteobacteria bacterium]